MRVCVWGTSSFLFGCELCVGPFIHISGASFLDWWASYGVAIHIPYSHLISFSWREAHELRKPFLCLWTCSPLSLLLMPAFNFLTPQILTWEYDHIDLLATILNRVCIKVYVTSSSLILERTTVKCSWFIHHMKIHHYATRLFVENLS